MRWAAIVIPAALAGVLWLSKPEPLPARVTQKPKPAAPIVVPPLSASQPPVVIERTPAIVKHTRSNQGEATQQAQQSSQEPGARMTAVPESITPFAEVTIEPRTEAAPVAVIQESTPMVLVYTLESVVSPTMPVPEETKSSLARVVEFAKTVKHSDPIGDLRGIKDELLAIDFRKKSTKKN